jgi:hypothetical protein
VPQFCTDCPQADRNRSATKHERDTGPLALRHSPVTAPKQWLEQRVAIATAGFENIAFQKPPFFCSDKAILKIELPGSAVSAQIRLRIEFDV